MQYRFAVTFGALSTSTLINAQLLVQARTQALPGLLDLHGTLLVVHWDQPPPPHQGLHGIDNNDLNHTLNQM